METMESVQGAVQAWRRAHAGRRGPLPLELRRRAAELAGKLGDDEVAAKLDVDAELLGRWRERHGAWVPREKPAPRSMPGFVEVRPVSTQALPGRPCPELEVEVSGPGGRKVCIRGAMDLQALTTVIRAAVSTGTEG